MYSDGDLEAAVAAGALTPEAAASLRDYVAGRAASPAVDEEDFRLISGFKGIFVSVGAGVLFFPFGGSGSADRARAPPGGAFPGGPLLAARRRRGPAGSFPP